MPTPIDCQQATGDEQTAIGPPVAGRYEPSTARYEAGALLSGKYRLEALLGEGGMGSVWRACNVHLDLTVAIKLIRADLDRGELRARLQLEARAAAKLGHPAIVRVYDVGESELGDPFIVMEYLRGETLGQLLSAGRLPATRVAQLLLPIIDALAVAHGRGIVHRDLKPDNLMIALEEQHVCPKILDFGVAKLTDPRDSDHSLTECGAVVGSPEYMSPEQACGRDDVDASTDVWSMCVVLYEAVTGRPPFTASNYHALLRSIVDDDPQPLSQHGAGDDRLWQILERGLNKNRAKRYAKISELGQALASWLVGHGITEDASGSSLDSKWLTRSSDRSGDLSSSGPATPAPGEVRASHDSIPDSTGIVRGPFSATIRPVANGRTLTLGAAIVGCALLAVTLLALGHSPSAAVRTDRTRAAVTSVGAAALAPSAVPPVVPEPLATTPPPKIEVWPVSSAHSEPVGKSALPAARLSKPASAGVRANALSASPAAASSAAAAGAAPKPSRPLDLMAPY
ncbi:MAG: serine/threonine-protein kinase [Pseudomonadota bacterium]